MAKKEQNSLAQTAEIDIIQDAPVPVTVANMSREVLKARRVARIEKAANITEGTHVKVMLHTMDVACLAGPFYIAFMTTSELGQLFTNGKPFKWDDQTSINMYGAALFGEIILMCLTFFSQYIRSYLGMLDTGSEEYPRIEKIANGAMLTWYGFAAIGALGQAYYLYTFWAPHGSVAQMIFTWILIIGRVCIYTGGDYVCAKYLAWRIPSLKKLMQDENMKSLMYESLEKQDAESLKREKEADAHIRNIELEIESKDRRAETLGNIEKTVADAATTAVGRVGQLIDKQLERAIEGLPQLEGPKKDKNGSY